MPSVPDNHEAHDYAERIRERLPRRLQELREAARLSKYALWQKTGVSRDMIGCIEAGESIPTLHVLCHQLEGYDEIVVDRLMETIAQDGYRMQTLISEIVTSYPFGNRRIQDPVAAAAKGK